MKTIIDLQKVAGYPAEGIFKQSVEGSTLETMFTDYAEKIDNVLFTQYGNRVLYDSLEFSNELDVEKLELIKTYILSEMLATQYKWQHIIDTTTVSYNPTENYNMVEEETTNDNKNEHNYMESSTENGERHSTTANTNAVAPFETETFYNERQETGTATDNAYTDTTNTTNDYTTENELKRKKTRNGNIGVTTTQQMIAEERKIADYSVIKQIAHSVANCISKGTYYNI